jgi:hypothetical protein
LFPVYVGPNTSQFPFVPLPKAFLQALQGVDFLSDTNRRDKNPFMNLEEALRANQLAACFPLASSSSHDYAFEYAESSQWLRY